MIARVQRICFIVAAVAVLGSSSRAAIYLTMNGVNTDSVTVGIGEPLTIDLVSDFQSSDVFATIVFTTRLSGDIFELLEIKPEAGADASVEPYGTGYQVTSFDANNPSLPAPGVHYVFEYSSPTEGHTSIELAYPYTGVIQTVDVYVSGDAGSDTQPPSPNPMVWSTIPNAVSSTEITMTAATATDESGVQYYFQCVSNDLYSSGWQASPVYTASGLDPESLYSFRVKARDLSTAFNETGYSSIRSATTYGQLDVMTGLIGYWPMDEGYGLVAKDHSINSSDGVLIGQPVWTNGVIGGALQFNGSNHVNCGYSSVFDVENGISISAWVKIASLPADWTGIITKGDNAWGLSTVLSEARFRFAVTGDISVDGLTMVGRDQWHHVCGTYDGSTVRLYVDGVEDPGSGVSYEGPVGVNGNEVWISGNSVEPGREFRGSIDEVAVWNRALNPTEVQWLSNSGMGNSPESNDWLYVDDDAPADPWPGDPFTSDPLEDGSLEHPYDAIQKALNVADNGQTVVVLDGLYTGPFNRQLSYAGRSITLMSRNGPANCIIDCENAGTAFYFSNEGAQAVLRGFTIVNAINVDNDSDGGGAIHVGSASPTIIDCEIRNCSTQYEKPGAGIYVEYGHPRLVDCTIEDNVAVEGGGIFCGLKSGVAMSNCTIRHNIPDGIAMDFSYIDVTGKLDIVGNDIVGQGTIYTDSDVSMRVDNVRTSCSIRGLGTVYSTPGKWFTIGDQAVVNLTDIEGPGMGYLVCGGLLTVSEQGQLYNAIATVNKAHFTDNATVTGSTFIVPPVASNGRILLGGSATFADNIVSASGDRYIDYDPRTFAGSISDTEIYVTVERTEKEMPELLELRGRDMYCPGPNCPPGIYDIAYAPPFDPNTWTIRRLELAEGARLSLTNRFDYQSPYDSGGESEVCYVGQLVLGPNSVLDTGFNRLYYESLQMDPTARIVNRAPSAYELGGIDFADPNEFLVRVATNNFSLDQLPQFTRKHILRVVGLPPDVTGMMRMINLRELNPDSPYFGQMIRARAKGSFARTSENEIMVRFKYLFENAPVGTSIQVYLSDVPEIIEHTDPLRAEHYVYVGQVEPPPPGRPGSVGSRRFGLYAKRVSGQFLDFSNGLWVELELVEPGSISLKGSIATLQADSGASALVDSWNPAIVCFGICLDINYDTSADEADYMTVIGECGHTATGTRYCLDGVFSTDGYVDSYDIVSWDWAMGDASELNSYCGVPLAPDETPSPAPATASLTTAPDVSLSNLAGSLDDLLLIGKRGSSGATNKYLDRLYVFDKAGVCKSTSTPPSDRYNMKIVKDPAGQLYAIDFTNGIVKLDDTGESVVSPGAMAISASKEPRYGQDATVYVGMQSSGPSVTGRPILDAEFTDDAAYVVPVVVDPANEEPYLAAARLQLLGEGAYTIEQLYDDSPLPGDNRSREGLREIEVDSNGDVYVINSGSENESDVLWRFKAGGQVERVELGKSDDPNYIPSPVALYMSDSTDTLYVARGQLAAGDPSSSWVYGFSTTGPLKIVRTIKILGMQHICGITEDPVKGSLWVAGFSSDSVPEYPNPSTEAFYKAYLAEVPVGATTSTAVSLYSPSDHDLSLPLAILWTGETAAIADFDGDGKVTFKDFAIMTQWWNAQCSAPTWCGGVDLNQSTFVGVRDLDRLARQWLDGVDPFYY